MEKGIIYKAENILNGMVYIGCTTKDLEQRKEDHRNKSINKSGSNFHEAISTYGIESFEWEQIDTANDVNELALKEKEYILVYNSLKEGYNSDSGGGIKKRVFQFDLSTGEIISEYESLNEASLAVNSHKNCIANVCSGQNKSCKGFYWSYTSKVDLSLIIDARKKGVIQYDLEGIKKNEFASVAEASRATGIPNSTIARCCRGEREMARGYKWNYKK